MPFAYLDGLFSLELRQDETGRAEQNAIDRLSIITFFRIIFCADIYSTRTPNHYQYCTDAYHHTLHPFEFAYSQPSTSPSSPLWPFFFFGFWDLDGLLYVCDGDEEEPSRALVQW